MRVVVLHQAVSEEGTVDEKDVFDQLGAILASLEKLGHDAYAIPCTLDLAAVRDELARRNPDVVFNLVESLAGSDRLITVMPALLDVLGYPYTGVGSEAIALTTSKLSAKRRFQAVNLPTAPWMEANAGSSPDRVPRLFGDAASISWPARWMRKPVWEHASFGMTDDAVTSCRSLEHLDEQLRSWVERLGRPCLAEPYIEGREFNLSLVGYGDGVEVLPPAEIQFVDYPAGKPRIVNFAAKWTEDAEEYVGTPRTFEFAPSDAPLLAQLRTIAERCWYEFGLRGYARVDFRVDEIGRPWILEINANPCIAPWSGFTAAWQQSGRTYDELIERLLALAMQNPASRSVRSIAAS